MNTLLHKIAAECGLTIMELGTDTTFSAFPDRHDYFIFHTCRYEDLLSSAENKVQHFEYILNDKIVSFKKNDSLLPFKERFLDNNLSLILTIEVEELSPTILKTLHRIEENSIVAKKYVLPYTRDAVEALNTKLNDLSGESITADLNIIAIQHSQILLQQGNEAWYQLLMALFIKVPFLNYRSSRPDQVLDNLSNNLSDRLSDNQKNWLSAITTYDGSINIEDYITQSHLSD